MQWTRFARARGLVDAARRIADDDNDAPPTVHASKLKFIYEVECDNEDDDEVCQHIRNTHENG